MIVNNVSTKHSAFFNSAVNGISEMTKGAFYGGAIGMIGGAFVGAIIDGVALTASGFSGEVITVMLSLWESAGTGAAVGASAFASIGAATGGMMSIAKNLGNSQPPLNDPDDIAPLSFTENRITIDERQIIN
jgi:hypothetical protein